MAIPGMNRMAWSARSSSGCNILSHRLVLIFALGKLILDHVSNRHQADENSRP